MKNYLKQSNKGLFFDYYAYVDTDRHLAENIFIQEGMRVRFDGELRNSDNSYRIVLCRVRKRDSEKFACSMEKLYNKMIIMRYTDIEEFLKELRIDEL